MCISSAVDSDEDVLKGDIATLEQIAVPFTASLMSSKGKSANLNRKFSYYYNAIIWEFKKVKFIL